ncbi:uncharacterized protein L201_005325 [Kwoniella dendrophila CBS 6074]|uniref:RING-14 protein n=1 Tax=Kwoniella dendrophila CBS 6074 TaxID=1295534 RepID=A0AAX4JYA5_9TREE
MKYGKEFQHILEDSSFPPDWKDSAIEYGQLKKLIKNVVQELTSMGLSPEVLNKLLVTEVHEDNKSGTASIHPINGTNIKVGGKTVAKDKNKENDDVLEFEYESPENTPPTIQTGSEPGSTNLSEAQEVTVDPLPNSPRFNLSIPSSSSSSSPHLQANDHDILSPSPYPHNHNHRKFRLRLLSDSTSSTTTKETEIDLNDLPKRPMNVAQFLEAQEKLREEKTPPPPAEDPNRGRKVVRRAILDRSGGVKAEYVLTGDPSNPIPQLRLHVHASRSPSHSSLSPSPSPSPSPSISTPGEDTDLDTDDEEHGDVKDLSKSDSNSPSNSTPRPFDRLKSPIIPTSPTLRKIKTALSPIFAIASGRDIRDGMGDLTIGDAVVDHHNASPSTPKAREFPFPLPSATPIHFPIPTDSTPEISTSSPDNSSPTHERDFIIPLSSDLAFFHLLTSALTSLSTFHSKQQELFKQSVENVCGIISSTISPSSSSSSYSPQVIPIPPVASSSSKTPFEGGNNSNDNDIKVMSRYNSGDSGKDKKIKTSKKDLYIWREIFSLWIESEIFESNSERTRGERTLEDSEKRLKIFANEIIKRGLGDRRTLKGKKSRNAYEEFLKLNVWLLDLKRFQQANILAARKILKKHDKRTALTALEGFPTFVRSTLSSHVDLNGNVSTWAFYNTSLPHILLASLTNTLLPILPSLDDYACLICTSIAFKPIRLNCGHLFCVRCLVKMQKDGKEECPLCRSKVVLLADKNSLDLTVMNFMKSWFPKEVKLKQKENELEVAKEQAKEAGLDTRCLIM